MYDFYDIIAIDWLKKNKQSNFQYEYAYIEDVLEEDLCEIEDKEDSSTIIRISLQELI